MGQENTVRQVESLDERTKRADSDRSQAGGADSPSEGLEAGSQEQVPWHRSEERRIQDVRSRSWRRADLLGEQDLWQEEDEALPPSSRDVRELFRLTCKAVYHARQTYQTLQTLQKILQAEVD